MYLVIFMKILLAGIISVFLLLPFEGARFILFGIPIYFIEAATLFCVLVLIAQLSSRTFRRQTAGITFIPPRPVTLGILALVGSVILSIIAAHSEQAICPFSPETSLRALGIVKSWFLFPILFGYVIFLAAQRYFSREKLLSMFTVSFLPFGIYSSLMWVFGSGVTYDRRFEGIFNSPNALALFLEPAAILSWYFLRTHKTLLWPLSAFIFFFLLFLTHSYSAWLALGMAILFFEGARCRITPKTIGMALSIALASIALFSVAHKNSPRFEHFFSPDSRSSFASRVMIWKSAEKMIADSPIFGIGPGNFQSCYLAYQPFFPPYLEWSVPEPHNIFLAFWLESGVLGLISFCFLIVFWFRNISHVATKKEPSSALLALSAIMIALLVHGLFDTPYWRMGLAPLFWIIFFLGIFPQAHRKPPSKMLRGKPK